MIRELHVYGELMPVGGGKKTQHQGLGKILLLEAEHIAKQAGAKKMAVISGVGARGYYRKTGYKLKDSYMLKSL
jgi:elongator complex protein 3